MPTFALGEMKADHFAKILQSLLLSLFACLLLQNLSKYVGQSVGIFVCLLAQSRSHFWS